MKINRFNEKNFPGDNEIVVKVIMSDSFEVSLYDIKKTDAYWRHYKYQEDKNFTGKETDEDMERSAIFYGLEEYIYTMGMGGFAFELYDKQGNKIEDLELFRTANKYNL